MRSQLGNGRNNLAPGYICAEYARWGTRNPTGCGHFRVEHDEVESLVLDYLVEQVPQLKALVDATNATDVEAAAPLLAALSKTREELGQTLRDMEQFTKKHLLDEPPPKTASHTPVESLYDSLYSAAKPRIEKIVAEKEAELEALLDGFAGLSPKLKERGQQTGGGPPEGDRRPPT